MAEICSGANRRFWPPTWGSGLERGLALARAAAGVWAPHSKRRCSAAVEAASFARSGGGAATLSPPYPKRPRRGWQRPALLSGLPRCAAAGRRRGRDGAAARLDVDHRLAARALEAVEREALDLLGALAELRAAAAARLARDLYTSVSQAAKVWPAPRIQPRAWRPMMRLMLNSVFFVFCAACKANGRRRQPWHRQLTRVHKAPQAHAPQAARVVETAARKGTAPGSRPARQPGADCPP